MTDKVDDFVLSPHAISRRIGRGIGISNIVTSKTAVEDIKTASRTVKYLKHVEDMAQRSDAEV